MFTATDGLLLPTTVTGSWPRPTWFSEGLWGRSMSTALQDIQYREQFSDALAVVISDQERAGLDIVTTGDLYQDQDFGGRSWINYPLERWTGLSGSHDTQEEMRDLLSRYEPGSLLYEVVSTWRWPQVVDRVDEDADAPLDYAKIWRLAQSRTSKAVKFGTVSAQVPPSFLRLQTDAYSDDKRELMWDMATLMNRELRRLVDAGCRVVQIEEPYLHHAVLVPDAPSDLLDFLVDVLNHELAGLEDAEVWIHTCWGNPHQQSVYHDDRVYQHPHYAREVLELYLDRVVGDVLTIDLSHGERENLEVFGGFRETLTKKVTIGAVSHRSLQVESPAQVADKVRTALEYIPAEHVILSSACGFGRQGCTRSIALYKAAALAQGANLVRRELGAAESYVAAADHRLQMEPVLVR